MLSWRMKQQNSTPILVLICAMCSLNMPKRVKCWRYLCTCTFTAGLSACVAMSHFCCVNSGQNNCYGLPINRDEPTLADAHYNIHGFSIFWYLLCVNALGSTWKLISCACQGFEDMNIENRFLGVKETRPSLTALIYEILWAVGLFTWTIVLTVPRVEICPKMNRPAQQNFLMEMTLTMVHWLTCTIPKRMTPWLAMNTTRTWNYLR